MPPDIASDIALWRHALALDHGTRIPPPDASLQDDLSVLRALHHADGLHLLRQGLRSAFPGAALRLTTFWPDDQPHAYLIDSEARPAELGDLLILLRQRSALHKLDCRALFLTFCRISQPDETLGTPNNLTQIGLYESDPIFNVYAQAPARARSATFLGRFDLFADLERLQRTGDNQRQWRYLTPCASLADYAQWPDKHTLSPLMWRWPSGSLTDAQPATGSFTHLLGQLAHPQGLGEDCSTRAQAPTWSRLINTLLDRSWAEAPGHALKSGNIVPLSFWTRLRGFLTAEYLLSMHSLQKGFGASIYFEVANSLQDLAREGWTVTTGFAPDDLDAPGMHRTLQHIAESRLAIFGMSAEDPLPITAPRQPDRVNTRINSDREGQRVLLIDVIHPDDTPP